jgi:ABC-type iron transport system FetAB ATPase subunit
VRIFGESMFALDEDGRAALRARSIGFVFQSFQLLPHLTALENVLLPLELTGRTPEGEDPVDAARGLLGRVGLGERLTHYPKYLSGGEQQRVALARAFVLRPPLLADEPTGSLDARTGEAVIDLMFELNRERGQRWCWSRTTQALPAARALHRARGGPSSVTMPSAAGRVTRPRDATSPATSLMSGPSSAALPCSQVAATAVSHALNPCASNAPSMPASTSPVPAVASAGEPVGLIA